MVGGTWVKDLASSGEVGSYGLSRFSAYSRVVTATFLVGQGSPKTGLPAFQSPSGSREW